MRIDNKTLRDYMENGLPLVEGEKCSMLQERICYLDGNSVNSSECYDPERCSKLKDREIKVKRL